MKFMKRLVLAELVLVALVGFLLVNQSKGSQLVMDLPDACPSGWAISAAQGNDQVVSVRCRATDGTVPPPVVLPPPIIVVPPPVVTPPVASNWNGTCPGFARTVVIPVDWNAPTRMYTANFGGFGTSDALVIRFTTGPRSSTTSLPRMTAAEFNSPPSSRTAVLSDKPCDFAQPAVPGAFIQGNSITAVFALGTGGGFGYYPALRNNTEYFLNVKNTADATCATTTCDMFVDLVKPGDL